MRELNVPSYPKNMAEKRKRTYHFHSEWEEEYIFTTIKETRVSHLRGDCGDGKAPQFGETLFFFSLHTKATMLPTHREACYGQKKPVS